jgi:hypothetical protein
MINLLIRCLDLLIRPNHFIWFTQSHMSDTAGPHSFSWSTWHCNGESHSGLVKTLRILMQLVWVGPIICGPTIALGGSDASGLESLLWALLMPSFSLACGNPQLRLSAACCMRRSNGKCRRSVLQSQAPQDFQIYVNFNGAHLKTRNIEAFRSKTLDIFYFSSYIWGFGFLLWFPYN